MTIRSLSGVEGNKQEDQHRAAEITEILVAEVLEVAKIADVSFDVPFDVPFESLRE